MGMDMYIYRVKNRKILDTEFWNTDHEDTVLKEVYYSRKFWDLHDNISVFKNYECGEYKELTKADIKEMIDFSCYHRDYFGSFNSVIALCEIYDNWDEDIENGYHFYIECDW